MLFIISAPSGAGKTSLVKAVLEAIPTLYVSISHTTRERRAYEKDGADYHFVSREEFEKLVEQGMFLEYAQVFDNYYGTSRQWVEEQLATGKDIILEIDWQGAQQVREVIPSAVNIFVLPPSFATLEERLSERGDDNALIDKRMQEAMNEIRHYLEYDYLIINDDFNNAVQQLLNVFHTCRHSYKLQDSYFDTFVEQLLLQGSDFK